jgi:hypothetical protein
MVLQFERHPAWLNYSLCPAGTGMTIAGGESESWLLV